MKLKAVINLFGGPNSGKSVLASDLFSYMKKKDYNVELITEYAKDLTWEKRHNILMEDQLYIFAKQHRKLLRLKDTVEYAICDSPLILSGVYYNSDYNIYDKTKFMDLILETYHKYPNINFYLKRDLDFKYFHEGRNQTLEESQNLDNMILYFLKNNGITYNNIYPRSCNIENFILEYIG